MGARPDSGVGADRGRGEAFAAATLVLSGATSALILTRHRLPAGITALAGAVALAGAMLEARMPSRTRDLLVSRVLDRVLEASILVPLAWVNRSGDNTDSILALWGLGASYLASYQRAKGQALHYQGAERPAFLWTRYAVLVLALLTGWLLAGLWAYVVLASAAALVRAWNVARQARRDRAEPGARG